MRKTLPVKPRRSSIAYSDYFNLDFEYQACSNEMTKVKFGSPNTKPDDDLFLPEYEPIRYVCSRSIPSSSLTRFPLPGRVKVDDEGFLEVSIEYHLSAVLLRSVHLGPLAQISKDITILDDSYGIQPPTCVTDYPEEYTLSITAAVRSSDMVRKLFSKVSRRRNAIIPPRLLVSGSEPSPLVFRHSQRHATTSIAIKLTIFDSQNSEEFTVTNNTVKITWRLQQSRFSSFEGLKHIPTRKKLEAKNSKLVCKTVLEDKTTYTCHVGQWLRAMMTEKDPRNISAPSTTSSKQEQFILCEHRSKHRKLVLETARPSSCTGLILTTDDTSLDPHRDQLWHSSAQPQDEPSSISSLNTPPLTLPYSELDLEPQATSSLSQIATRTTNMSIPISIPLSSFKQPTSTTSCMVIRYSLQIDICVPFTSISKREHESTIHHATPETSIDKGGMTHKTSWTAGAHLVIPIQLTYVSNLSGKHSMQNFPETNTVLGDVDVRSDGIAGPDRIIMVESAITHTLREAIQAPNRRSGDDALPRRRQNSADEEILPTYGQSTGQTGVAIAL